MEGHRRAGNQRFGVGDVTVEQLCRPARVTLGETAHSGRVSEAALGRDAPADNALESWTLELARAGLQRVTTVAFLIGALAERQVGLRRRCGPGPAAGRKSGAGRRAKQDFQLALPVRTTMILLVPDSGR